MNPPRLVVSVPDAGMRDALGPLPEGVEIILWDFASPAPRDEIDLVVPPYLSSPALLTALSKVKTRLVQSAMVGYDGVADNLPPGRLYANAASVHETSTSEMTLALILAAQRGIPDFVRAAGEGHWAPGWRQSLADRTVVLVGYGGVGRAIEARLAPFEVNSCVSPSTSASTKRGVIHDVASLPELLPTADVVVIVVPLSAATTQLVDDGSSH